MFDLNFDINCQPFYNNSFSGTLTLNVTVRGYNSKILKKNSITPEVPQFTSAEDKGAEPAPITASLSLYLVNEILITPSRVTLYNHPGNKEIISVKQGSGYFELALSATDIALVKYKENTKEIEVLPMRSGELTVQIVDLCLVAKPAVLIVNVVSVGIIRVEMADKVC